MGGTLPMSAKEIADKAYESLKAKHKLNEWYSNFKDVKNLNPESNILDEATLLLKARIEQNQP